VTFHSTSIRNIKLKRWDFPVSAVLGLFFFTMMQLCIQLEWTKSFQSLFTCLGSACFVYLILSFSTKMIDDERYNLVIVFAGIVLVAAELFRVRMPGWIPGQWFTVIFGMASAVVAGFAIFRMVQKNRNWLGKIWFFLVCLLVAITGNPSAGFITFVLLISQAPFLWIRNLRDIDVYKSAVGCFLLLMFFHFGVAPALGEETPGFSSWSFIPIMIYSLGFGLVRAFAWATILFAIFLPFKPRKIRSRLRWAFLLNFLVPAILIFSMSLISLIFLIGGYQAATAKRMLFQIGTQAREQALHLYETAHGISREAPGPSPFFRVGAVRFIDGSIQEWRNPPTQILDKLVTGSAYDIEFILAEEPVWELWIAGFYRMTNGSGAVIAYKIDATVLDYIQEVVGFDLKLTPGLDWSFLPFTKSDSTDNRIMTYSLDENEADPILHFPIGAILITSFREPDETSTSRFTPKPYATVEVVASRQTMAQSLVKTNVLKKLIANINLSGNLFIQDENPIPSAELQSVNILNLAVFIFLSMCGGVLAGLIVLSLIISHLISRKISHGLGVIKNGTSHLHNGDLDYRIPIVSHDELGELAADFNAMANSLKTFQSEREQLLIEKMKQDRLQNEFETARLIQNSLLPVSDPDHPYLAVTGVCFAAEEVGGDYFDYLDLPDQSFGVAIGDVSGHGMSAGLLMSMAKSCLLNQIRMSSAIPDVIRSLNAMVCDSMKQKMLMTFLYAIFSPDGRSFSFASAGHNFPYVFCLQKGKLDEPESISYPLGVRRDINVQIQTRTIQPGDLIVFYTDGIVEAQNPAAELFGYHRFERLIRAHVDKPVHLIRKSILDEVNRFKGTAPDLDDVTLVLVKVKADSPS
jgi:serine phosphatase RsbU (regulator of sigma subunit)